MENMENQNAQNTQVAAQAQQNPVPAVNSQPITSSAAQAINADDLAAAVMSAIDARRERAERAVIKSFAEQNGVSVGEIAQLISNKAKDGEKIPADVQRQIDERLRTADNRLISAEVRAVGTELNIIDIDAAFALMDKSGVKVGEDGSVTGVKEALEALTAAKPYLVKAAAASAGTGSTGNFPRSGGDNSADYAARLAEARKSGNHGLATAIISEAAAKGILLR